MTRSMVPKMLAPLAALALAPGLAAARAAPAAPEGMAADAAGAVTVTLLTAMPGTGGTVVASGPARTWWSGAPAGQLDRAAFARLEVAGHAAVFAVDRTAAGTGPLWLHVAGAPGSQTPGVASVGAVATDLYQASLGDRPLVLLARGHGADAVTFAIDDPSQPFASGAAGGADRASLWLDGTVRSYPVRPGDASAGSLTVETGAAAATPLRALLDGGPRA